MLNESTQSEVYLLNIKIRNELILLLILVIVLIIAISFFPHNTVRIVFGVPFLLFFPGYALIAALFPRRAELDGIERIAMSFGMSIAVVPLIGLILNYTPWGIRPEPALYSISLFIFAASLVAWYRRRRLPQEERFRIVFRLKLIDLSRGAWDRVLSVILAVVILGAIGTVAYLVAVPRVGEKFTEFYILGLDGKATDYPEEIRVGEPARVIVGIVNREHEVVSYRVEVKIDELKKDEVGPIVLSNEQKWEEIISFRPDKVSDNVKVEFVLYKNGEATPHLEPLHLWVNVIE